MSEEWSGRGGRFWMLLYGAYGIIMVALICLLFWVPIGRIAWLRRTGWGLFGISALLGWLPILAFRRHGHVARGKTYIHTTSLVTTGLYAIVRHPQYFASSVLAAAVMCISQHWSVYLAGALAIAVNHVTMAKADRDLVEKFGEPYSEYMRRVPRWNIAIGLWHWLRRSVG